MHDRCDGPPARAQTSRRSSTTIYTVITTEYHPPYPFSTLPIFSSSRYILPISPELPAHSLAKASTHPIACIWSPYLVKYALSTPLLTCGRISPIARSSSGLGDPLILPRCPMGLCFGGSDPFRPICIKPPSNDARAGTELIRDKPVSRLARAGTSTNARVGFVCGGGVKLPTRGPLGPIGAEMLGRAIGASSTRLGDDEVVYAGEEIARPRTSFLPADDVDPDGGPSDDAASFFEDDFLPIPPKNDRLDEKDETDCIDCDVFIPPRAPLAYCACSCGYGKFGGSEFGASAGSTARWEISRAVYESARMGNSELDETLRACEVD